MALDITEIAQIRKEHQLLFDQVPCSILLIDRNFRIVKSNRKVEETFGNIVGKNCFEALKGFDHNCLKCTAGQTFQDGLIHSGQHSWKTRSGAEKKFLVSTAPLRFEDGNFDLVMEVAVDITQTLQLKDELRIASSFMESLIATSIDGIIAVDGGGDVTIFNRAARKIFQVDTSKRITKKDLTDINFISIQDLSKIHQLENEKLEAERLAAVGQTVAGLAHGVKNLITGLEGGMYMLNSGISKGNADRIGKGMEMLNRNINRISKFVQEFLSFSKGRKIKAHLCDPLKAAEEVVNMYSAKAKELGIKLVHELPGEIAPAYMDSENINECLTNLVGNAIDACRMSEDEGRRHVLVRTIEKDDSIIYEVVDDGCGMDYEVKNKVFTSFFTTKGLGGTGLGLLMTKKIVQEHGGRIELETEPGEGTTFRIILPRDRLPEPAENAKE